MGRKDYPTSRLGGFSQEQLQKLQTAVQAREEAKKARKDQQWSHNQGQKQPTQIVPNLNYSIPFMTLDGTELIPTRSFTRLTQLAALAAHNQTLCFTLTWPTTVHYPALIHALASLASYITHNSRELRTLYWPAKANTGNVFKHICVHAGWLQKHAAGIVDREYREQVDRSRELSIREKTWLFLKLHYYCASQGYFFPLDECFHCFHYLEDGYWERKPKTAFSSLSKSISKKFEKQELRTKADYVSNPIRAVDSLFLLHRDMGLGSMRQALNSPQLDPEQGGLSPNLAILDFRAMNWSELEKKWSKIMLLVRKLQRVNGSEPAGILGITDSPSILDIIRTKFNRAKFFSALAPERPMPIFEAVQSSEANDLRRDDKQLPENRTVSLEPKRFDVQLLGRQTADVAAKLQNLAFNISRDFRKGATALRQAADRLTDISMLPDSLGVYEEWLSEQYESDRIRYVYSGWNHLRHELNDLLEDRELGDDYVLAENLIKEADEHVRTLLGSTPAALALEEILDLVTGNDPRWSCDRLLVAVDAKMKRIICQEKIEELFGPDSNIEALLSSELPEAPMDENTGLVHLLTNQDCIRYLFMLQVPPRWGRIIISHGKAARIFDQLGVVLDMRELQKFHPLAERFRTQIEKSSPRIPVSLGMQYEDPFISWSDFLPRDSKRGGPGNMVTVELEGHPPIYYSQGSMVYIFDEDSSWGYRGKAARELQEDELLLIPSKRMYKMVESYVQRIDTLHQERARQNVKAYHEMFKHFWEKELKTGNSSKDEIVDRINREYNLQTPITKNNFNYWLQCVNGGHSENKRPYAPLNQEQFLALARELGFPEAYAQQELQESVRRIRSMHQQEGRQRHREILSLLSDHLDHISRRHIPTDIIWDLYKEAKRNSHRIRRVWVPAESKEDS